MNFEIRLMILHYFLWIFHNTIILINVLGWISPKTRKLNLITLSLTLLSWVGFGYWHGWGYCFLTDWHYRVLTELGYHSLPYSYIKFLVDGAFGSNADPALIDNITLSVFIISIFGAFIMNWRDLQRKK